MRRMSLEAITANEGVFAKHYWHYREYHRCMSQRSRSEASAKNGEGQAYEARVSEMTFADCTQEFLARQKGNLKWNSQNRHNFMIARLSDFFSREAKVESISAADIQRFIAHRDRDATASSIAGEVNLLKRILALALELGALDRNPAEGIKAPSRTPPTTRSLTKAEFRKVLEACPSWLRPIVEFSIATGLTQAELLKMRWVDIEEREGNATLCVSKGREVRKIPLNGTAVRVLKLTQSQSSAVRGRVFKGRQASTINISQAFRRASRSVGIHGVSFRDLRNTAATWMLEQGVPLETVAAYLGYKTLRMTERFLHQTERPLSEGVSAIDRYVDLAISQCQPQ
jgi:integrase